VRAWRKFVYLAVLGILTISAPLLAHHGNAAFDTGKPVTVKATVTDWVWANPHCWLKFDVKDDKGDVVHWVAETSPPTDIVDRGWTRQTFKPGDQITVIMSISKGGRSIGRVQQVVLPDGQILGTQGTPAPPSKPPANP
jgi:hypothetical protein